MSYEKKLVWKLKFLLDLKKSDQLFNLFEIYSLNVW